MINLEKNNKYYFILSFVLLSQLLTVSCDSQSKQKSHSKIENLDSVIVKAYIRPPKLNYIGTDSQAIFFENAIKLDAIRNGFDSLQLRVSFSYPLESKGGDSSKILIIKRGNGKWSGSIIKTTPLYSNDSLFYLVTLQRQNVVPRSGWDVFIKQLFDYRLLSSPFYELDEENAVVHEPTSILFQIGTVNGFKQYRYLIPSFYEKEYWQIEDLKKIIKLLEVEMEFKVSSH